MRTINVLLTIYNYMEPEDKYGGSVSGEASSISDDESLSDDGSPTPRLLEDRASGTTSPRAGAVPGHSPSPSSRCSASGYGRYESLLPGGYVTPKKRFGDRDSTSDKWEVDTMGLGESYTKTGPTIGCPKCSLCSSFSTIFVFFVIGLFFLFLSVKVDTTHYTVAYQGDTVMVARANLFWYKSLLVSQIVEYHDQLHDLSFLLVECSNLTTHKRNETFLSLQTESQKTRFVLAYEYLLKGSHMWYSICLWKDNSSVVAAGRKATFFVFDEDEKRKLYLKHLSEGDGIAISKVELEVGTGDNHSCYSRAIEFNATTDSYYFLAAEMNEGVSYQYNSSVYLHYLDISDYDRDQVVNCSSTSSTGQSCSLPTHTSFLPSWTVDHCLIGGIASPPVSSGGAPRTHLAVTVQKRYEVLLIPGAISLLAVPVVFLMMYCVVRKKKKIKT